MTQILNLLGLPVEVRNDILEPPEHRQRRFCERNLRTIARMPSAARQIETFERKNLDPGQLAL